MKEIRRLDRPSLEKTTADRLNAFLQDLLTMNVNDVVGIALEAYFRWAKALRLEEIDEWIHPLLKRYKADYERLVFSSHRRFIMIIVLGDFLGKANLDRSHSRSALAGWREISKDAAEQLVQQILSWLADLAIGEAFDAMTELILRWADQYNDQMAIEFAQSCGRIDADRYSDENITMFLRWCFHDDLEFADAQLTWHNWAD